jgi:putative transcriptional regulator
MAGEDTRRITITLDDLLRDRGMTLTELSERIGLTLANLSILKTGKAKAIRFSTLEAICRELDCQPGDLLAYSEQAYSKQESASR